MNLEIIQKEAPKKMLLSGMTKENIEKEITFAIQAIKKSSQLQKCSPESLRDAVINVAQVGLSLNPILKQAYLVPRFANGGLQAVLDPSFGGLIHLATNGGLVVNMTANVVHENDKFEMDIAANLKPIRHEPFLKGDRGAIYGSYAIAFFENGTAQAEWMSIEEIHQIMDKSESYKAHKEGKVKQCTWVEWFDQMARKAVVKRLCKYIGGSDNEQLAKAIELDNNDYGITTKQLLMIEDLLLSAEINDKLSSKIYAEMNSYDLDRAKNCIEYLKDNQPQNKIKSDGLGNTKDLDVAISTAMDNESFYERKTN